MIAAAEAPIAHITLNRCRDLLDPEDPPGTSVAAFMEEVSAAGALKDSYAIVAAIAWKQGQ